MSERLYVIANLTLIRSGYVVFAADDRNWRLPDGTPAPVTPSLFMDLGPMPRDQACRVCEALNEAYREGREDAS